jgi:hypothetical protein
MEVARLDEVKVRHISMQPFKLADILNLLQLRRHKRMVRIPLPMHKRQHSVTIFPAVLAREPARRLGKQDHHAAQEEGGQHLQAPGDAPRGSAVVVRPVAADEGAAVGHVVHDEDAPGDGPLLEADEAAALRGRGDLGDVDGDLGGLDAHAEAVDHAADAEHGDVLGRGADDGADDPGGGSQSVKCHCGVEVEGIPDNATNHDGLLPAEAVRQRTGDQRTSPGPSRHGRRDAALDQRLGTAARRAVVEGRAVGTLVEVAFVALHAQLGRERRDIEAEERTADDRDAGDDIDVADRHG